MKYDPMQHHRRSIRLWKYDYSRPDAYFITICTHKHQCLFGEIKNQQMILNEYGEIAQRCWLEIPQHFTNVSLDLFIIMPNHIHGIIIIDNPIRARHAVPLQNIEQFGKPVPGSIPTVVRSFKSATTKRINKYQNTPGNPVWQRNYYEHVIRNEKDLHNICEYISNNPQNWETDENYL